MESLAKLREIVAQVLQSQINGYLMDTLKDEVIQSKDLNRFFVVRTGWHLETDHHALLQDVVIQEDGKVVIYANNTDDELVEELVEAGIPAVAIVEAYNPDTAGRYVRPLEPEVIKPVGAHRQAA